MKSVLFSRSILAATALVGALALAACSDSGEKKAEAPAAPATPSAPATPAPAAEAPKPAESAPATTAEAPKPAEPAPATTAEAPKPAEPAKPAVEAPKSDGSVDVAKLMAPGALPDMAMGKADAPVTIVEYASMTCVHCASFHKATMPELKTKYVDTGKVRVILREFPFDPRAEAGFMLARCSKDNYFPMVDVLFKQQEAWVPVENAKDALLQLAKLAGFSQQTFEACLTDQALLDNIRAVRKKAEEEFGITSTPTFFINGEKYAGAMSIDEISAIIDPKL